MKIFKLMILIPEQYCRLKRQIVRPVLPLGFLLVNITSDGALCNKTCRMATRMLFFETMHLKRHDAR